MISRFTPKRIVVHTTTNGVPNTAWEAFKSPDQVVLVSSTLPQAALEAPITDDRDYPVDARRYHVHIRANLLSYSAWVLSKRAEETKHEQGNS